MQLIHEFDFWATLDPALVFGEQVFAGFADGGVSGERLNGAFLKGGGDWNRVMPDGWCDLDVRAHIQTDDGAQIYMRYTGLLELSGMFTAAASAQAATTYADQYLRVSASAERPATNATGGLQGTCSSPRARSSAGPAAALSTPSAESPSKSCCDSETLRFLSDQLPKRSDERDRSDMQTEAAICWGPNSGWSVETVELDPPRTGEVLVRIAAAGLCHTDEHLVTGDLPGYWPVIGGHEGAAIVEEVGPGVDRFKPGDHVVFRILSYVWRVPSVRTWSFVPVRQRRHPRGGQATRRNGAAPCPRPGRQRAVLHRQLRQLQRGEPDVVRQGPR